MLLRKKIACSSFKELKIKSKQNLRELLGNPPAGQFAIRNARYLEYRCIQAIFNE